MSEPSIRALALDIDGTLIGSDKRIPDFTRGEVVRVVEEYGAHVFLVTARPPASARLIAARLGVPVAFATFSGALVEVPGAAGMSTLRSVPASRAVVVRALDSAVGLPVHIGVYGREAWVVSDIGHWGLREARNTAVWPAAVGRGEVDRTVAETDVFKVMFRGETEHLVELEQRLSPFADDVSVHRSGNVLEFTAASARKFSAVEVLCAHVGIDVGEVISFGDTSADREMLESTGVGILMGNAEPGTAPGAERTLSNDEDGVGMMLRRYFPTARTFDPWGVRRAAP